MRPNLPSFDELVNKYKEELQKDPRAMQEIEKNLEEKQSKNNNLNVN
ncbi:Fur-regulated basic protein B [Thalassobacillus cyri]|uniref:Fur-regulated basic protein B n=1 Tax=Thalassobacillus cyri TaxID=571932 RepID=A0A1H4GMB8_9BACI|nr:FbpB family small basic protein [Thalassobacillus cyri]SEB10789.1 Fur-regulated basic protein B [Thalassobacillus cyri]